MDTVSTFLRIALLIMLALLALAAVLHVIPKLGRRGRDASAWLCRAPGLDLVIAYFTALPLVVGPVAGLDYLGDGFFAALGGLMAAVLGQVLAVLAWTELHELTHPSAVRGPRIVHTLNRHVGRWRNHSAVWITAMAVPVFFVIRVAEYVVYPPLTALIRLPKYRDADWVNVSRQKFSGLVGHDLIWCLYCDWMTGVWSLGSEMLRNVESFWCPIRFHSEKKCENCRVDFPDVADSWVPASGTMQEVTDLLDAKLTGGNHAWHGHPTRLTVEGRETDPRP